jgi:hypothetical protein
MFIYLFDAPKATTTEPKEARDVRTRKGNFWTRGR